MNHLKPGSDPNLPIAIQEVSKLVSKVAGIQLGDKQSAMVESRLRTRLLKLGLQDFSEYLVHLRKNEGSETQALLSLLTTHHTYFFREFGHFEYLLEKGLPAAIERVRKRSDRILRLWSAACSRGQEVYSLAMFLKFHLKRLAPDLKFEIWGSDVDPESVEIAKNGVYKKNELKHAPQQYLEGNWISGKGDVQEYMKAKSELLSHCHFATVNLLEPQNFLTGRKFDFIFCRNVFIYFNSAQITQISNTFHKHLEVGGEIFLGVSESLGGLNVPLRLVGPSVYCEKVVLPSVGGASGKKASISSPPSEVKKRDLQILCVDDSPTILALMKRILTPDSGMTVAATAKNGREALRLVEKHRFDLITLDLHMPELDGVGFLRERTDKKTPVLIVSAINREDPKVAQQALSLGAADYVEKPSLQNLGEATDEIRSKIKTVIATAEGGMPNSTSILKGEEKPLKKPIRVLIVDDSSTIRQVLSRLLSSDSDFQVVAQADHPSLVEALIREHRPDLITLDIHMPEMDGVSLLKKIHPHFGIPTVMISSISKEEGPQVLEALEVGAVDYIQKPQMNELKDAADLIRERLKVAARARPKKDVRVRKVRVSGGKHSQSTGPSHNLVLIGASTGGTEALRVVFESMPDEIPPIVVVQHIPPVFSAAFAQRLNEICPFEVREAQDGDEVLKNRVLIAPGGKQMGVHRRAEKLIVRVNEDPPMNRHKPSVDYLFQSAAKLQLSQVVAVVLTGMGADGARELKVLRDLGARTIAQDEATSVVYGMPKEAAAMGGAEFQLPLDAVAEKIILLIKDFEKRKEIKRAG